MATRKTKAKATAKKKTAKKKATKEKAAGGDATGVTRETAKASQGVASNAPATRRKVRRAKAPRPSRARTAASASRTTARAAEETARAATAKDPPAAGAGADPGIAATAARSGARAAVAERNRAARGVLRKYAAAAAGVGALPFPLLDLAAITSIQLALVRRLCALYGLDYDAQRAANWISSLAGSVTAISLACGKLPSLLKAVPIIGSGIGALTMPLVSGATTYALGVVFIQHFDSGGTMLTFDPEKVRDFYRREVSTAAANPLG